MGSVTVTTDGCLPPALDRLYAAVGALVDPIKEMHDGAIVSAPSLYEQLVAAIPGTKGEGLGRRTARAVPPLRTDALDRRIEIDNTVRQLAARPRLDAGQTARAGRQTLAPTRHRPR